MTADDVVDAAVDLLVEVGPERFSMRKLGAALGVNPMTVYLRFDNKDELLDAVAHRLLGTLDLPPAEGPLDDQVVAYALAIRTHLREARSVLGLVDIGRHLTEAMLAATERGLTLLVAAGLDGEEAVAAFRSIFWAAVGLTLADTTLRSRERVLMADTVGPVDPVTAPTLAAHLDHFGPVDADLVFETTIRGLFAGLRPTDVNREQP